MNRGKQIRIPAGVLGSATTRPDALRAWCIAWFLKSRARRRKVWTACKVGRYMHFEERKRCEMVIVMGPDYKGSF